MTAADSTQTVPQPTLRSAEAHECEVLLIRHGRSPDVVPGSAESADPPLHVDGEAQARLLAERLRGKSIDAVYCSHLARARQTAAPIAVERGLVPEVHRDLEEVRLGDWANGEFRRRAAVLDPEWVAWSKTGRWDGIPGGEGDDAFRARVSNVVDTLAAQHRGGRGPRRARLARRADRPVKPGRHRARRDAAVPAGRSACRAGTRQIGRAHV